MSLSETSVLSVPDTTEPHEILRTATKEDVSVHLRSFFCSPDTYHLGPRCNRGEGGGAGLSTCLCIHAEENALLEAGRERIREGAILYCDT